LDPAARFGCLSSRAAHFGKTNHPIGVIARFQKEGKTMGPDGGQVTLVGGVLASALAIGGCNVNAVKTIEPEASTMASAVSYPSVDAELGEHLYPEEKRIADELSVMIEDSVRKQYSAGSAPNRSWGMYREGRRKGSVSNGASSRQLS
jgi:hypothetical protein